MSLRSDRGGFIFSLDAVFAVLVILVVLAGVAQIGESSAIYEQHGYLRLERYADDALEVMELTGVMDNVFVLMRGGDFEGAKSLARTELLKVLPQGIHFKLEIAGCLEVYPGPDEQMWTNEFENAAERAVATRVMLRPPLPVRVLVWLENRLPDPQPELIENFAEEVRRPLWDVRIESDEDEFREYLENKRDWYPEVVFIPDAMDFKGSTVAALVEFNRKGGGVVGGGGLLWNNRGSWWLWWMFGLEPLPDPENKFGHDVMEVIDHSHYVTAESPENIEYAGENYPIYEYRLRGWNWWDVENVLAVWPGTAGEWPWWPWWEQKPWIGVIARTKRVRENEWWERWGWWGWGWRTWRFGGNTVCINAHLAQSAMGPKVGTHDWITLAQRAIEWASGKRRDIEQVKLYVWRG